MNAKMLSAAFLFAVPGWAGLVALGAEPAQVDVEFKASVDGSVQRYVVVLFPSYQPERTHDVLVVLHGHGSDRWQFVRDNRDECRAARDFAARHAMILVSPDYRARTSWMGPAAEADVAQILSEMKSKHRVGRVFLCGGSMGGTAALTFAALHPEGIAGLAAMNGAANLLEYENFQDAIQASFGGTKASKPLEYKNRSAEYWPERLTMPIACTVSGNDVSVPPDSVRRLTRVLRQLDRPVLLLDREHAGHATSYADATEILEFVWRKAAAKDVPQVSPP